MDWEGEDNSLYPADLGEFVCNLKAVPEMLAVLKGLLALAESYEGPVDAGAQSPEIGAAIAVIALAWEDNL